MTSETIESIDHVILDTLAWIVYRYGKFYCYPSQAKLLELLEKKQKVSISRRTLNRHLKKLEALGYFIRVRRHKRNPKDPDGPPLFFTTLYRLTAKFSVWMKRTSSKCLTWFKKFYVPSFVKRVAQYKAKEQVYFAGVGSSSLVQIDSPLGPEHIRKESELIKSKRPLPAEIRESLDNFYHKVNKKTYTPFR